MTQVYKKKQQSERTRNDNGMTHVYREKHPTFSLGLLRSDLVPASFQSVSDSEASIERHRNEDGGPNERNENEEGADCGSFQPPSTLFDPHSLELWSVRPRFCHYMERFILSFRTHSETKWSRNEIFIVLESFHRYDHAMHCIMKWHPNEDRMTPEWYKNENGQNYHFQACRQWSPRVAKSRQVSLRFKGDPMDGWDELKPDRSYLSHFPPWYSKSGQFPIKNEKWPLGLSYGSIILKIVLWPYFTLTHAVLTESRDWKLLPSPPLHQGGGLIIICSA